MTWRGINGARMQWEDKNVELVIVDDSSTDNLVALLREYRDLWQEPPDINYVKIDNRLAKIPMKFGSCALGLNIGVKAAKNEIIIKTDPENWWMADNIAAARESFESRTLSIGTVWKAPKDRLPPFEGDLSYLARMPDGLYYYIACFSKSMFLEIRGIDEGYGHGWAVEDEEFRERFAKTGHVRYEPRLKVVHLSHKPSSMNGTPEHKNNLERWARHRAQKNRTKANEGYDWGSEKVIIQRGL